MAAEVMVRRVRIRIKMMEVCGTKSDAQVGDQNSDDCRPRGQGTENSATLGRWAPLW
jgi:hypothetical protein